MGWYARSEQPNGVRANGSRVCSSRFVILSDDMHVWGCRAALLVGKCSNRVGSSKWKVSNPRVPRKRAKSEVFWSQYVEWYSVCLKLSY